MTRRRDERGVVGGGEGLAFGALVLVAGTLMITNVWAIVETRTAVDAAAREYLRAYTHGDDHESARGAGERAARAALAARGTPLHELRFSPPEPRRFGPCGVATVEVHALVPATRVPFLGTLSRSQVRVRHTELIDAHREVTPHAGFDPSATPCA